MNSFKFPWIHEQSLADWWPRDKLLSSHRHWFQNGAPIWSWCNSFQSDRHIAQISLHEISFQFGACIWSYLLHEILVWPNSRRICFPCHWRLVEHNNFEILPFWYLDLNEILKFAIAIQFWSSWCVGVCLFLRGVGIRIKVDTCEMLCRDGIFCCSFGIF